MGYCVRRIEWFYTRSDGISDIILPHEQFDFSATSEPQFLRRYSPSTLATAFRAMGCQIPLNQALSDWIFSFLRFCPTAEAARILSDRDSSGFEEDPVVLSRLEFHRLACAAMKIHEIGKIRAFVNFRLALDFIEERRFMILLLSGAPGTGKSTMGSLLASRMSIPHIISTDSIRHALRTTHARDECPILYSSTYECGDVIDAGHCLGEGERVIQGYLAQSEVVGTQLMKVIRSFAGAKSSLIVEGVHLSVDVMVRILREFPNVIPFLIYVKSEDFHEQRFAVRAKYMTTDPCENRYIASFGRIRAVQDYLCEQARRFWIPKIDNTSIDRSMDTLHSTIFSYIKMLGGRMSMFDPVTNRLTFLVSIWKRGKRKLRSRSASFIGLGGLEQPGHCAEHQPELTVDELLASLPRDGGQIGVDGDGMVIVYNRGSLVILKESGEDAGQTDRETAEAMGHREMDADSGDISVSDLIGATDSEVGDTWGQLVGRLGDSGSDPLLPRARDPDASEPGCGTPDSPELV
jgi:2-phosphoglycerate kinase